MTSPLRILPAGTVLALLIFVVPAGAKTSCYVCDSQTDTNCGENNFSHLTNALKVESGCEECAKVVGKLGGTSVQRQCVASCPTFDLTLFGVGFKVECCSTFLCNSATYTQAAGIIVVGLVTIAMFLKM